MYQKKSSVTTKVTPKSAEVRGEDVTTKVTSKSDEASDEDDNIEDLIDLEDEERVPFEDMDDSGVFEDKGGNGKVVSDPPQESISARVAEQVRFETDPKTRFTLLFGF